MKLEKIQQSCEAIREEIGKVVIGQPQVIDLLLIGMLSKAHILLEGVPGTGKTLLARTFSMCMSLDFNRIQFTPDLMPGDILGTNIFNFSTNQFALTKGPIFTQILLADEINRTPPKTQAALLQAMQERTVSIDNEHYDLGDAFMVIATQNPVEQQGTYPLPEAQLDRFLFKIIMDYPGKEDEIRIVMEHGNKTGDANLKEYNISKALDLNELIKLRGTISEIFIKEEIATYIVEIIRSTRENTNLLFGASTRSANMIATAARAYAAINGRDFVIPDDIKFISTHALRHRVILSPNAEIEGLSTDLVIEQILDQIEAPK